MKTVSSNSKTTVTWYLLNPPCTTSVDKIKRRSGYFCRMTKFRDNYYWEIVPRNGKPILMSDHYKNKAQCRNVMKHFAEACGIEWREQNV